MIIEEENIQKINKKNFIVIIKWLKCNFNKFYGKDIKIYLEIYRMVSFYNY